MSTCAHLPCSELSRLDAAWQMIRFEKETRYYTLQLEEDLLGDWVVVTIHGRINSKLGQNKLMAFESFDDAFCHFKKLCHLRHLRKYHITSWKKNQVESHTPNKQFITNLFSESMKPKKIQNEKNIYNIHLQKSFLNELFEDL